MPLTNLRECLNISRLLIPMDQRKQALWALSYCKRLHKYYGPMYTFKLGRTNISSLIARGCRNTMDQCILSRWREVPINASQPFHWKEERASFQLRNKVAYGLTCAHTQHSGTHNFFPLNHWSISYEKYTWDGYTKMKLSMTRMLEAMEKDLRLSSNF